MDDNTLPHEDWTDEEFHKLIGDRRQEMTAPSPWGNCNDDCNDDLDAMFYFGATCGFGGAVWAFSFIAWMFW